MSVGHGASSLHVPLPLLSYDAVLSAVAKGAYELHDYVDYSTWLRGHLIPVRACVCVCVCVRVSNSTCTASRQLKIANKAACV